MLLVGFASFVCVDFEADEWSKRYLVHLEGLKKLKKEAPNWTTTMQNKLYKDAWYGHIYLQVTIYLIVCQ